MNTSRIIEICQEIDRLQGELREIVAGDMETSIGIKIPLKEEIVERIKKVHSKPPKKKDRRDKNPNGKCKECGFTRYRHSLDCSQPPKPKVKTGRPKVSHFAGHACCGSKGSRHKNSCGTRELSEQEREPTVALADPIPPIRNWKCIACDEIVKARECPPKCPERCCTGSMVQVI